MSVKTFFLYWVGGGLVGCLLGCAAAPEPASPSEAPLLPDDPSEPGGPGRDIKVGVEFGGQEAPEEEQAAEPRRLRDPPPTRSYEVPDRVAADGGPPGDAG